MSGSFLHQSGNIVRIDGALRHTPESLLIVDAWLYQCHTILMKTAVSLPDRLYHEAEKTARSMGIPRSRLFAKALEEFIEHHKRENVTERLNLVYANRKTEDLQELSAAGLESIRELTRNDTW